MLGSLREMELRCLQVRSGNLEAIEILSDPFIKQKKGLMALIKGQEKGSVEDIDLMAASEALLCIGAYREAIKPLELLIDKEKGRSKVKDLALARAGQIAVRKGLPIDLGPIISELGLSRRDLESALTGLRISRGRKEPLVELERSLLQAMLLHERTGWIESDRFANSHLKGSLEGFERAIAHSSELEGDIGAYHGSRCRLELTSFLLSIGEFVNGMKELEGALSIIRKNEFKVLLVEGVLIKGTYSEDEEEGVAALIEAEELSIALKDSISLAAAGSTYGQRSCSQGDIGGVDRIMNSVGILKNAGWTMEGAVESVIAALWAIRLGDPPRGINIARDAYKVLRSSRDRELLARTLSVLFYGYMKADDRGRAKRLLLEIVSEQPVKQFPETFSILKEAVRGADWLKEDKDTKTLFEDERVYTISRDAVEEIKVRAREAYPQEFGAMLRGIENITHIEPIMEGAANRSSFMFSMFSRFTQRSVPGEGVVHSHPSGSARPSKADVSLFGRFPGINIIIAYPFEDDSMAAYDRMGNRVPLTITNE